MMCNGSQFLDFGDGLVMVNLTKISTCLYHKDTLFRRSALKTYQD